MAKLHNTVYYNPTVAVKAENCEEDDLDDEFFLKEKNIHFTITQSSSTSTASNMNRQLGHKRGVTFKACFGKVLKINDLQSRYA